MPTVMVNISAIDPTDEKAEAMIRDMRERYPISDFGGGVFLATVDTPIAGDAVRLVEMRLDEEQPGWRELLKVSVPT